jgi:hypothetical protein
MTEENNKSNEGSNNDQNLQNIQKLKDLLNSNKSDLFEILSLKEKIKFNNKEEEEKIINDIWLKEYFLTFPPKDSNINTKPNINQLNLLISSAEKYKIKDAEKINRIKYLQEQANNSIKEISRLKSLSQLNIYKENIANINLDLSEYLIQKEMKLKTIKEEPIPENNTQLKDKENPLKEMIKTKHKKKTYKKKDDSYEKDFIQDEEESELSEKIARPIDLSRKEGSNMKRIAESLQRDAENYINQRSRRHINKKRDDDYVYDEDLKDEGDNEEIEISINKEKHRKKKNEGDEEYEEEDSFEKKERAKMLNKKVKRNKSYNNENIIEQKKSNKIMALNSSEENKMNSRKKALNNILDLLKQNKYLMDEGIDFVTALANKVEEDLAKAFPEINFDYHKTLNNMNKTLKEISKYKRINQLVIKGKLILFKMAKYSYGDKFIQKLKNIEEGSHKKSSNKPKKDNNTLDYLSNAKKNNSSKLDITNTISGISNISNRSGFSQSSFNEGRNYTNTNDSYYSKSQTGSNINRYKSQDNDDSLESIEDQANIKFSPGVNEPSKGDIEGNINEGIGNNYDPFNIDKINFKSLYPILYDPSLDNYEDDMSEENVSEHDNDSNLITAEPPPQGSTLRIFHGKIKLNHNTIDKVSLYSCNQYEKFLKFPAFEKELILSSKTRSNEVIPYCLKHLNNSSKVELYGWIEPDVNRMKETIEVSKFSELIEEFERNEKCSCLVDNKIKLYVFTLGEKDKKLYNKIVRKEKFINKRLMESLNTGNKFLVFVLLSNKDDLENEAIKKKKKIYPEIIQRLEYPEIDEEEEDDNKSKKNKNLSIVMEEEEENNPNSSINKQIINNDENEEGNENEENNEEDEESIIDKEENEKLKNILEQNDFNTINDYIESNFNNLPLEEMAQKLQRFSQENRDKLLKIIKLNSERISSNDNQMDVDEENNNNINQGIEINNMNQMNQQMNNNMAMMNQMNNMNQNYAMNMYQNDPNINQMYNLGGMNNINIPQQQNNNANINPNIQQMYYNQGLNIYNNYGLNFK